ncbi:MAG: hypothetical protein PVJ76_21175, partial [Gemmatimonadota bacterium]
MGRWGLLELGPLYRGPLLILAGMVLTTLSGCQLIGGPRGETTRDRPTDVRDQAEFDPTEGEVYQGYLEIDGGRVQAA